MKVTVISGGTGSIALKKGLSKFIPKENLYTIVNAYDNGLSTGLVRKVFNGDILGPSDVRKQQLLDYSLYRDEIGTNLSEKIFEIFSKRYTFLTNPKENIEKLIKDLPKEFKEALDVYFSFELAHKIKYIDFSIANIIYGSFFYMYGHQNGTNKMADFLNLPHNIIFNSEENLYLGAITESGSKIYDESEIVNYNNPKNKIVDVFLFTKNGKEKLPTLSKEAKKVLKNSDLIITSSGTQFSSLIPTYKTIGFLEIIENKPIYMIMNLTTDNDMTGYSKKEEYEKIKSYLKFDKYFYIECLEDCDKFVKIPNYGKKHNEEIGYLILDEFIKKADTLLLDFDDTIMTRTNNEILINYSLKCLDILKNIKENVIIVTGKPYKEVKIAEAGMYLCNYGNSICKNGECVHNNIIDTNTIIKILKNIEFNFSKFENRNNNVISLRFLDDDYRNLLYIYLKEKLPEYQVIKAGKSTIDIMKKGINKYINIKNFIDKNYCLYLGDEKDGNDKEAIMNINSYIVNNPLDTYTILKIFEERLKGKK